MSSQFIVPISEQDVRTESSAQVGGVTLGQLAGVSGGRLYRYSKNGAVALSPGKLTVNADVDANAANKTIARTYAIGATEIVFDAGGTIVADAYKDGYLTQSDATGEGYTYAVAGNTGVTGAGEITIYLKEPIKTALTIDVSEATLVKHDYDGLVISATDQADLPTGVPNMAVTIAYYHWEQVGGSCAVWWDEAVTRGQALTIGTGSAGAVEALDAAGEPQLGVASMAGVDTEYQACRLGIA